MVDWATQDRLYPAGYRSVSVRNRSNRVDSSLPHSVSLNPRHSCRSRSKQFSDENLFLDNLYHGLTQSINFHRNISENAKNRRIPKFLAMYASNINWPRSVCCLPEDDGSLIVCEQDRCRLLLFSSRLMLRSTCGGKRGNGPLEFDSPWSVATSFDNSTSNVLVADTDNRRIQVLTIGYNGRFLHQDTLLTKEKPFFIATSKQHFAVSCEKGLLSTFLTKGRTLLATIDMNQIFPTQKSRQIAYCLCMDPENSSLFLSNPIALTNAIYQLTVTGEYLRSIKLHRQPFLHISSLTFDPQNGQLLIVDSLNSIIYSVEHDLDEDNVEILLKRSDNINYPQALCLSNEGHLVVVECSVLTQHALKIFRHHACVCHSRMATSSVKTSETTSVRSTIFRL